MGTAPNSAYVKLLWWLPTRSAPPNFERRLQARVGVAFPAYLNERPLAESRPKSGQSSASAILAILSPMN